MRLVSLQAWRRLVRLHSHVVFLRIVAKEMPRTSA
jgi:hypothetical protein